MRIMWSLQEMNCKRQLKKNQLCESDSTVGKRVTVHGLENRKR